MKVHHLNCGTMRPLLQVPVVCHVLLVESGNGLVLVDSGFGLADIAHRARRTGPARHLLRPAFDPDETAVRQIERLGFRRDDVRDIVVTHFDLDHIGGIADFPHARIHVTAAEAAGAMHSPTRLERMRYQAAQWAHGPNIVEHDPVGEAWRGFAAAKELTDLSPGIVLISLPGHSRGHACVAVDAGHRWVLHCGDAIEHRGMIDGNTPVPAIAKVFESVVTFDRAKLKANQRRLAELYRRKESDLLVVCAHDPVMFDRAQASS